MAAWGRPAAPGRVCTREGAALADGPGRGQSPPFLAAAIGLVVLPVSVHAFALSQLASLLCCSRAEVRRWHEIAQDRTLSAGRHHVA
jgi:hypothetical protein